MVSGLDLNETGITVPQSPQAVGEGGEATLVQVVESAGLNAPVAQGNSASLEGREIVPITPNSPEVNDERSQAKALVTALFINDNLFSLAEEEIIGLTEEELIDWAQKLIDLAEGHIDMATERLLGINPDSREETVRMAGFLLTSINHENLSKAILTTSLCLVRYITWRGDGGSTLVLNHTREFITLCPHWSFEDRWDLLYDLGNAQDFDVRCSGALEELKQDPEFAKILTKSVLFAWLGIEEEPVSVTWQQPRPQINRERTQERFVQLSLLRHGEPPSGFMRR